VNAVHQETAMIRNPAALSHWASAFEKAFGYPASGSVFLSNTAEALLLVSLITLRFGLS
jgi:hypothetical protein